MNKRDQQRVTYERLPAALIWVVLLVSALPIALSALDIHIGMSPTEAAGPNAGTGRPLPSGALLHALFEWSSLCTAAALLLFAVFHFRLTGDAMSIVIGIVLCFTGVMDG